jgi:predicted transcriptional regulator
MSIYIINESDFMRHKITLPQLKKYDITQKVITALADAESRVIIFSIIRKGKTASELSSSLKIPLSSVYKKLSDLENLTLVRIEKTILSEKGRRFKVYRSRINKAEISIKKPEPTLSLSAN